MPTPALETERLLLRPFTERDIDAIYKIFGDVEANRFLPWFPLPTREAARAFYETEFAGCPRAYYYAICFKGERGPIGYVHVGAGESRDFGYGLCREFWRRGIASEAGKAVVEQLKRDGVPYITATHDVNNPRSGGVMKRLGMTYQYSYVEQWQPKNIAVTFRMYQLNLDGNADRVYREYWNSSAVHFVETNP